MWLIVANIEKLKLPTKHVGVSRVPTRGSDDTTHRPTFVKASHSVSFGRRANHCASTRDSSPVRHTKLPPYDRNYNDVALVSPYRPSSRCQESADQEYGERDEDRVRDMDGARGRNRGRDRDRRYDHDKRYSKISRSMMVVGIVVKVLVEAEVRVMVFRIQTQKAFAKCF